MMAERRAICRAILAVAALVAAACAVPAYAFPGNLREGLFGRGSESRQSSHPPVGRYISEDGDAFTFDRSQTRPLLKFDNSPEVWALEPQFAPRGDVIYKNDLGEPVLRATRLGGVTVFTSDRPGGSAAAFAGAANPIRLAALGPQALLERLAQSSARASHAARRLIPFDADASPASSALIADASVVASEAVLHIMRRRDGRDMIGRVRQVRLAEGRRPGVQLVRGSLQITVAPAMGVAGRPSSERIVAAVEAPARP